MTEAKSTGNYFLEVARGEYVFRQNDPGSEMFIVEDGQIAIVIDSGGEKELTVLERGDFFGEMAILENLPRVTSARAKTDSRLLRIDRPVFDQIIRTNPEFAVRMLRALSGRLREMDGAAPKSSGKKAAPDAAKLILRVHGGSAVPLREGDSTVGRYDASTDTTPDVDLTEVDTNKTTSRRHARITCRPNQVLLQEDVGTANGTFVNGMRLDPGVPVEIQAGDRVEFGGVSATLERA